jgi:hypothetical protein
MITEAVALFERIFNHDDFRSRQMVVKRVLSACSVYIVCRQHGWPVTISNVSHYAGCSPAELDAWKKKIINAFDDMADVRPPDLFELVDIRCKRCGFSEAIRQTTVDVILLCRELWISDGRKPDNVITSACYLAWQGEEPMSRIRIKLGEFCRLYQLTYTSCIAVLVRKIKSTLCLLAEQIPWHVTGTINVDNVVIHLSDVLHFRSTLVADAQRKLLASMLVEENDDNNQIKGVSGIAMEQVRAESHTGELESVGSSLYCHSGAAENQLKTSSQPNIAALHNDEITSPNSLPLVPNEIVTDTLSNNDSTANSNDSMSVVVGNKRRHHETSMFEPLWLTHQLPSKKVCHSIVTSSNDALTISSHPDIDSTELSCHDIPDSELHAYIKDLPS